MTQTAAPERTPEEVARDVTIGEFVARYSEAADGVLMDAETAQSLAIGFDQMREENRAYAFEQEQMLGLITALQSKLTKARKALKAERETLREVMLKQPISGQRETYSDGFAQGVCFSIGRIDTTLSQLDQQEAARG